IRSGPWKRSPRRIPSRPKPGARSAGWPRRGCGGAKNRASSGMRADRDFPRLTPRTPRVTSPATVDYNCVAWAAGDTEHWWQPGVFWPVDAPPQEYGISALEDAFRALGFEPCDDDAPEP